MFEVFVTSLVTIEGYRRENTGNHTAMDEEESTVDCGKATVAPSKQERNKSDAVWETLITTLIDKVSKRSSYLEKILDMIRRDLTYENPGLFPSCLLATPGERDPIQACNFWLINHLLHIASVEDFFK